MKHYRLFQAWQSADKEYTKFITNTVKKVASRQKEKGVDIDIVRFPAQDEAGSPDVVDKLWEQIKNCDLYIGDLTSVDCEDRIYPNSNVIYETGIADAILGERRVILVCSADTDIEKLPFDINHKRISPLQENDKNALEKLNEWIEAGIRECEIQENQRDLIFKHIYEDLYVVYNNLMRVVFTSDDYYSEGVKPPTLEKIKEKLSVAIIDEMMISVDYSCIIDRIKNEIENLYNANRRREIHGLISVFNALDHYNWCLHAIKKNLAFAEIEGNYKSALLEDTRQFYINRDNGIESHYGSILFNDRYVYTTGKIIFENVFLKEMLTPDILKECHSQAVSIKGGYVNGIKMRTYHMKAETIEEFTPLIYNVLVSIFQLMDAMNFTPSTDTAEIESKTIICWIK